MRTRGSATSPTRPLAPGTVFARDEAHRIPARTAEGVDLPVVPRAP